MKKNNTVIILGILLFAFGIPFLLVLINKPENTGIIGDTFGGIAGPIINVVAGFLVYLSFQAQRETNLEQKRINQKQEERINKQESDIEDQKLFDFLIIEIRNLQNNISNFVFDGKHGMLALQSFGFALQRNLNNYIYDDYETFAYCPKINTIFLDLSFILDSLVSFNDQNGMPMFLIEKKLIVMDSSLIPTSLGSLDLSNLDNQNHLFYNTLKIMVDTQIYLADTVREFTS